MELQTEAIAAQKGAKLLDEHISDWYKAINVRSLDLNSNCNCVLGQLFKTYTDGLMHLQKFTAVMILLENNYFSFAVQHGFYSNNPPTLTHRLNAAWINEIRHRQHQAV
jgi:hypothetical protein